MSNFSNVVGGKYNKVIDLNQGPDINKPKVVREYSGMDILPVLNKYGIKSAEVIYPNWYLLLSDPKLVPFLKLTETVQDGYIIDREMVDVRDQIRIPRYKEEMR
jgi:hypothetical protein